VGIRIGSCECSRRPKTVRGGREESSEEWVGVALWKREGCIMVVD
jgi:hypothetical protein